MLDYAGGHELSPEKLKACLSTAASAVKHLCLELETALEHADQEAQKEMLQLLQLQRSGAVGVGTELLSTEGGSHLQATEGMYDNMTTEEPNSGGSTNKISSSEAEEAYRQQALDYMMGHLPSSVREDRANTEESIGNRHESLFSTILKAAGEPVPNE